MLACAQWFVLIKVFTLLWMSAEMTQLIEMLIDIAFLNDFFNYNNWSVVLSLCKPLLISEGNFSVSAPTKSTKDRQKRLHSIVAWIKKFSTNGKLFIQDKFWSERRAGRICTKKLMINNSDARIQARPGHLCYSETLHLSKHFGYSFSQNFIHLSARIQRP